MTLAFHTAMLPHQKTPIPLKDLLVDVEAAPRRKQSPEEIKARLMMALGA